MPDSQPARCPWVDLSKPDYIAYHDDEWGRPGGGDERQFEFLVLESAQAGLSWYTVLRKRENYRTAFAGFDPQAVAAFDDTDVQRLLGDAGIIRNRAKIVSAINNAARFLEVQREFGSFCAYIDGFVGDATPLPPPRTLAEYRATSEESDALAADMKRRGFKFVGSTVMYAHMQATGLVNDHSADCYLRNAMPAR